MKQAIKERIEQINQGLVPSGYKQTPVGVCPIDWKFDTLGNLGEFSKGSGIPGYTLVESGIPCVGYGDLYTKYSIKFEKAKCFTDIETAKQSKEIAKGTLLFTGSGETAEEIGKCVCYNGNENICAGGDIVLFNTKKVNPLYISYQQNLDKFIKEKSKLGQGHSVVHIYANDLSTLSCLYPSEDKEQQKIANILTTWDNAVELQEKKIEKLQEKKKALMQKLLTPKPDWKEAKLGDICEISTGKLDANKMVEDGKYAFFTCSKEIYRINEYAYDCEALLMAGNGEIGDIKYYNGKFNAYQRTYVLTNFKLDIAYVMQYLLLNFDRTVCKGMQKSSMPYIKLGLLQEAEILYPKNLEQISKTLKVYDNKLDIENQLLEKYKEQRKALMQLLLTGIVRV